MGISRFIPDFGGGGTAGVPTFIFKVKRTLQDSSIFSLLLRETKTLKDAIVIATTNTEQQFKRVAFFIQSATITGNERRTSRDAILMSAVLGEKETKNDTAIVAFQILTAGAFTFTVPPGVTTLSCSLWGAGGGGNVYTGTYGGGGGGGGAFSKKNTITVTPGQVINGNTGIGGTVGAAGGDTWFSSTAVALAKGGAPGAAASLTAGGAGGAGGAAGSGVGDTFFSGGLGGTGALLAGAGGAGGAGTTGNGGAASGATAGTGTPLNGGAGGAGATATVAAGAASNYGGGGGGAAAAVAASSNGAQGFATITYRV